MSDLLKIVGLTEAQFNALHENGSVTINGTTLNYSEDILYLVETNETTGSGGVGSLTDLGVTATAAELNYVDGVTSNIQTQLNGKLSTGGGTISGDLTLYAASGDSPKLRLQRGDNTGTITDWNINVVSGALNFNTVSVSGSTAEKTVASIGYNGQFNVNGSFMENGVALSDKYQAKGNYLTGITKDQVTTALGYTPPTTNTTYSVATASTAGLVKPVSVITKPTLNSVTTTAGKYYQVQMSNDGNMFVNVPWEAGSTSSNASTVSVTDTTPTSATTYYSLYSTGKSGNQTVRANKDLYFYDGGSYGYFNVGSSDSIGGLTLHYNNGKYVNLATATTLTANRSIYLPDADGTIITTGNFPTASSTTLGGIKTGYTTSGKNYKVQVDGSGNAYVNVPWSAGSTSLSSLGITATAAELNYTDGVTSNIQTQLNGKLGTTDSASFVKSNAANTNTNVAQPVALLTSNAAGVGDALYKTSNFTYNAQTGVLNNACIPYAVKSTSSSTTDGTKGAVRIRVYGGNLYIYTS